MSFPVSTITIPHLAGVIPCSVYCSSEQRYDRVSAMYVHSLSGFRDKSSSFLSGERIYHAKNIPVLKPQYLLLLFETKTTDLTDDA